MIKVFRLSDLIKYFLKFIIPIIIIIICLNIFIKRGNNGLQKLSEKENVNVSEKAENVKKEDSSKNDSKLLSIFKKNIETDGKQNENSNRNKSNKTYYFCLNSEIVNLKNVKDETKIELLSLLKKIIQSEFEIFNQSKNGDNNEKNNGNSNSEYHDSNFQKIVEYSLGLTPIDFNNTNDTYNKNSQNKNEEESSKNDKSKDNKDSKEAQNNNDNNSNEENNSVKQAEENVKTEVVSNSVNPRYNYDYNGVKIYNSTKYKLTNEMLDTSNFSVNKSKVLIYHTHTCESYTPTEKYNYQQTGNFRTTDLNFSVVRVGEELKKQLESYNIKVVQNKTYHDYPAYNGSYSRSLTTANNMLNQNKDADIVIDLHRDAIADSSYAPKVKIGEEYVSQMMFVIGTDIANSANSHWNENLKFAVKVQQKANEMYPRTI